MVIGAWLSEICHRDCNVSMQGARMKDTRCMVRCNVKCKAVRQRGIACDTGGLLATR